MPDAAACQGHANEQPHGIGTRVVHARAGAGPAWQGLGRGNKCA